MGKTKALQRNPWAWVPSLYVASGIPYAIAMTLSVVLYKRLGISNTDIALYTGWLYLPWVIKPLWSPLVDLLKTKRYFIILAQLFIGASLASIALAIPAADFFRYTLAFFWLLAFASATQDIAADGFYMLGLKQHEQAAFIGVRTTCYRLAMILSQGGLVVLAGYLEQRGLAVPAAWSITMFVSGGIFLALFLYHLFVLPYPAADVPAGSGLSRPFACEYFQAFREFFRKEGILTILAFLLLYRFAETQIIKIIAPFLLDPREAGGLGLTTAQVGIAYGTLGLVALISGGLLGGLAIYKKGLKFWIWIMAASVHLPNLLYVYLSFARPENFHLIGLCVAIEQFGYGFGFTAYTMFMIMVAEGRYKTVHYALATGIMALGVMIPSMVSGWLQQFLGYPSFFLWVMIATIPGFIVTGLVKIAPDFGKKTS